MAACSNCGSVVSEGAVFCSVCGARVSAADSPAPVAGTGIASNVAAALCYLLLLITGIIFLVVEPHRRDRYVRFHAFQSIFFSIAVMIFWIIWSNIIWGGFFSFRFLWSILNLVGSLISLVIFVYWLFLMYKAYNNERYMIPFVGEFALKQAGK